MIIERKFSLFASAPICKSSYLTKGVRRIFAEGMSNVIKDIPDFKDVEARHFKSIIENPNVVTELEEALFNEFYRITSERWEGEYFEYHLRRSNILSTNDIYSACEEFLAYLYKYNRKPLAVTENCNSEEFFKKAVRVA